MMDKEIRILQLGKFYPIRGGVEKVMYDIAAGLSGSGIRCDMLCASWNGKGRSRSGTVRINGRCSIFCRSTMLCAAGTMISPGMVTWLKKHCREYSVIHVHHPDPMAALSLRLSGFEGKVVLHWHSDIVSQKFLFYLYKPLQDWLVRRADMIVGTTPVYLESSPYLRNVRDKCVCVPIGIKPLARISDDIVPLTEKYKGKTMVLSVGRLVPYKGFSYLVKAASLLPDNYHTVIVGDGPLKDGLQSLIDGLGIGDRVTLTGRLSDRELAAHFWACDAFVLPSTMRSEAFGIVQIEAMSCGKPVVATNIKGSGVSWVNMHGASGINVEPGDETALSEAIQTVCEEKNRFGAGARALYEERYRQDLMIEKIIDRYETLCQF